MTQETETWTMQVPNGKPISVVLPAGSSDHHVRAAMTLQMSQAGYKNPNAHAVIRGNARRPLPATQPAETTEDYWRRQLGEQGALKAGPQDWRGSLAQDGSALGGKIGLNEKILYEALQKALGVADFIPGLGDAAGVADTAASARSGNWLGAGVNGLATAVGLVPGIGDALAGAGKAMFLGVKARNADLAALQEADELLAQGVERNTVRQQTGWFYGDDGKPRFEISDQQLRLAETEHRPDTLGEAVVHPQLFENYPSLANVRFGWEPGKGGSYRRFSEFGPERVALGFDLEEPKISGVLAHELEHAIQQREGFAAGSNPDLAPRVYEGREIEALDRDIAAVEGRLRRFEQIDHPASAPAMTKLKQQLQELMEERDAAAGFEGYWRTPGEVEARNTQRRAGFSDTDRQLHAPWQTADVPRGKQIFSR